MRACKGKIVKTWKVFAAFLLLAISVVVCGKNVQAAGRPVSISSCQIEIGRAHV